MRNRYVSVFEESYDSTPRPPFAMYVENMQYRYRQYRGVAVPKDVDIMKSRAKIVGQRRCRYASHSISLLKEKISTATECSATCLDLLPIWNPGIGDFSPRSTTQGLRSSSDPDSYQHLFEPTVRSQSAHLPSNTSVQPTLKCLQKE